MNRRGFLRTIAAGLTAAAIDPERLLWIPGRKTIFIPKAILPVDYELVFEVKPFAVGSPFGSYWFNPTREYIDDMIASPEYIRLLDLEMERQGCLVNTIKLSPPAA